MSDAAERAAGRIDKLYYDQLATQGCQVRATPNTMAAIIREEYAAQQPKDASNDPWPDVQPHPSILERAEAAVSEITQEVLRQSNVLPPMPLGELQEIVTRHFADLSPDAELREEWREAAQEIGEWQVDCPCSCNSCAQLRDYYRYLRAALERSK